MAAETSLSSAQDTLKKHQFNFDGMLAITGMARQYDKNPIPNSDNISYECQLLGLYIPEIDYQWNISEKQQLEAFASVALLGGLFDGEGELIPLPYRGWFAYTYDRLSLKVGYQEIRWGNTKLLRTLNWMDLFHPLGPVAFNPGIFATLGTYQFGNDGYIQLWVINNELDILDRYDYPRGYGGRVTYPLGNFDVRASYLRHRHAKNYQR
ncbi:hypothetical protein [Algivirga pacifica]|uniref:Uncharacterized protein n=1 Tax=Algivirga pacifica TaxID=1162670 RepID=A0ABP9DGW6_9BACT